MRHLVLVVAMVAGCGGTGDEATLEPTLSSIQQHIFTPKCATASCHASAIAPHLLSLREGESWRTLRNGSVLLPFKMRIVPGSTNGALMSAIQVDQWSNGVKTVRRMPPDSQLNANEIATVGDWTAAGALDD